MSFFSDLFEGNFGNLGTDLSHAGSSLLAHPDELAETIGGAALVGGGLAFGADALGLGAFGATDAFGPAVAADEVPLAFAAPDEAPLVFGSPTESTLNDFATPLVSDSAEFLPETSTLATGPLDLGLGTDFTFGSAIGSGDVGGTAIGTVPVESPDYGVPLAQGPTVSADTGTLPIGGSAIGTMTPAEGAAPVAAATPAPAGAPASLQSPSFTSTMSSLAPYARIAAAVAPLGVAMLRGQPQLPAAAQQAAANAQGLAAFGQQQLAAGQSGQLNAGQAALIANMRNDLTNSWRQTLFNMGVQNPEADTRWPQIEALIDSKVTAQTEQMLQQDITNGLNTIGAANGTLNQVAQLTMQADANFTNALVNAAKALGFAFGNNPSAGAQRTALAA